MHQGKGKKTASNLSNAFFEEPAFPNLLTKGKFGYKAARDIPISPVRYFQQRLLNFNQYFASDADYIYFYYILYLYLFYYKFLPGLYTSSTICDDQ